MNNIYILSFSGGSGGDFLAGQISNDPAFYKVVDVVDDKNTHEIINPLFEIGVDTKDSIKIDNNTRALIDTKFSDKNLILRTHFTDPIDSINLSRLKGIRSTVKMNSKLIPLYYTLLWMKRSITVQTVDIFDFLYPQGKDRISDNDEFLETKLRLQQNQKFYFFERIALDNKIKNSITVVHRLYANYKLHYFSAPKGWTIYNKLDDFYLNPKNNVKEFSELFGLTTPIAPEIIEEYFQKNVKLIENNFNKTLDNYLDGWWQSDLTEWVKFKCPGYYNIE